MTGRRDGQRAGFARLWVLGLVVLALTGTLVGRLGQVQIRDHAAYQRAAATLNTRITAQPALRGRILDRHGIPLVDNTAETVVTVDRKVLADAKDGGRAVVSRIAMVLGVPFDLLWGRTYLCGTAGAPRAPACWGGSAYVPVPLLVGADARRALSLLERPDLYPGVDVLAAPVRQYPQKRTVNAAQVLGYLAPATVQDLAAAPGLVGDLDLVGRSGLEKQYEQQLRGVPGRTTVAVDPRGVATRVLSQVAPVPGRDLVTTLDVRVQAAAESALRRAVAAARSRGHRADGAAAVVLDTATGGVLASASYPTYDPDVWTGGIGAKALASLVAPTAGQPLVNRVTSAVYPPASTFKVVSLPAAIRAGNSLSGTYDCASSYRIGNRTFANYESRAYGPISLTKAIEVSCDTIFYDFAYRSWLAQGGLAAPSDTNDPFVAMAHAFGLGADTGIDLPGERSGRVPDRAWKRETWAATRTDTCRRANTGYPDVARTDPARAAYLKALAVENCRSGFEFRAGDAANFAIGQGDIGVTPLQLTRAYAAIANGGVLVTPHVALGFQSPGGSMEPVAPGRTASVDLPSGALPFLHQALQDVVTRGTAAGAFAGFPLAQWPVAGKTGTAEAFGSQDSAWFVSYAPATKPRYAVAVVISQAGTGGEAAAPAGRQIYDVLRTLR
ncbi:MAG TPA: penicillin-binding protein 2 [Pedococcus sp.]|nr:penicillin-binding protein 2 [Pedococcus sp.]